MQTDRRGFLKGVLAAGAAPVIVPASVFGATAPSNKVQIAIIGCGRIGTTMDIAGMVVEACLKGKDIYVQKPIAFSIEESLAIKEAVRRTKRIFYTGTPRASKFKIGVRYIGENGDWIYANRFVSRIPERDRVDTAYKPKADIWRRCEANRKGIIEETPESHVARNELKGHHRIWFVCMRERKDTNIPVEATCSSTISCILGYHALNNPGRTIEWDPVNCKFKDPSDEKNLRNCFMRPQFSAIEVLKEIRKRG